MDFNADSLVRVRIERWLRKPLSGKEAVQIPYKYTIQSTRLVEENLAALARRDDCFTVA